MKKQNTEILTLAEIAAYYEDWSDAPNLAAIAEDYALEVDDLDPITTIEVTWPDHCVTRQFISDAHLKEVKR